MRLLSAARWAVESGDVDEDTLSLYVAPAFLEARMRQPGGLAELAMDFDLLAAEEPSADDFKLIANALRLSAPALRTDPGQLATQLMARLPSRRDGWIGQLSDNLSGECPEAARTLRTAVLGAEHGYFAQLVTPGAIAAMECAPDGSLVAILDDRGNLVLAIPSDRGLQVAASLLCEDAHVLSFTPSGHLLVVGARSPMIWTVDVRSRTIIGTARPPSELAALLCIDDERALAGLDSGVCMLRFRDGTISNAIGDKEGLELFTEAALAEQGKVLVLGGMEGRVDAWDVGSGRLLRRVGWFGPYQEGWESRAEAMMRALIGGGAMLVGPEGAERLDFAAMLGAAPELTRDDREARMRQLGEPVHQHAVTAIAMVDGGATVVAGSISGELQLWDFATGERRGWWKGSRGDISSLALGSAGDCIYLGGGDHIRVWHRGSSAIVGALPCAGGSPHILRRIPQSDQLLGARDDGMVLGWNVSSAHRVPSDLPEEDRLHEIAITEGNQRLWAVSAGGRVEEWDLHTGARISVRKSFDADCRLATFSSNGRRLVGLGPQGLWVVDVSTGLVMYRVPTAALYHPEYIRSLEVSDDGEAVLVATHKTGLHGVFPEDGTLQFVNTAKKRSVMLDSAAGRVVELRISPDRRFAIVGISQDIDNPAASQGSRTLLWDLLADPPQILDVAPVALGRPSLFSRDGASILWIREGALGIGSLVQKGFAPPQWLPLLGCRGVATTSDREFIATIGSGGEAAAWDLTRSSPLARFQADRPFVSVAYAPAARRLAALDSDGAMHILEVQALEQHTDRFTASREVASLAARLDAISTMDGRGVFLDKLADLGRDGDIPLCLLVSIALRLAAAEKSSHASGLLCERLEKQLADEFAELVDGMISLGAREALSAAVQHVPSNAQENEAFLRAVRWLIENGGESDVQGAANSHANPLGRLIAAQALADRDEAAATAALRNLLDRPHVAEDVRLGALVSLAALEAPLAWLELVSRVATAEPSREFAAALTTEVLRVVLRSPISRSSKGLEPPILPLRRALDWNNEAMRLVAAGNLDAAYEAASLSIRRRPHASRYYHTRGAVLLHKARAARGDGLGPIKEAPGKRYFKAAIADFTRAIERDRSHEAAWSQRGYARLELEEFELALQDISEALHLNPTPDAADLQNRAFCLRKLGRHAEAELATRLARAAEARHDGEDRSIVAGRTRVGDDPQPDWTDAPAITRAVSHVLQQLGTIDDVIRELRARSAPTAPRAVQEEARSLLAELEALREAKTNAQDVGAQLGPEADERPNIAEATEIALSTLAPKEYRVQAAILVARTGAPQDFTAMLRSLSDAEVKDREATDGLVVAIAAMKSLSPDHFPLSFLEELAKDREAPAAVRSLTGEVIAAAFDRALGLALLDELGRELPSCHPLQEVIQHAIGHFQSDVAAVREAPRRPDQVAFDEFMSAPSAEDVDRLAERHWLLRDPDFMDQVASLILTLPAREQPLVRAKLERLRALPPDPELVGFRSFARCGSSAEMREIAERYPFLTLPGYRAKIEEIIAVSVAADERSAFERRLAWLRQIPVNEHQAALQAFAEAETEGALRKAVEEHVFLSNPAFPDLATMALRSDENWPGFKKRLKQLGRLIKPDSAEQVIDAATADLMASAPERALERLDRLSGRLTPRGELLRAMSLVSAGRDVEALEAFTNVIRRWPNAFAYAGRGRANNNLRQPEAAIVDFNEALRLEPDLHEARLGRGMAHAMLHNVEAALEDLNHANAEGEDSFLVAFMRGSLLASLGRNSAASVEFRRAVRADPRSARAKIMLARLLRDEPGHEHEVRQLLDDARESATDEDLAELEEIDATGRAVAAFMRAGSEPQLRAAMAGELMLYEPEIMPVLHAAIANAPREQRAGLLERLGHLESLAGNPAQRAFDTLMSVRSDAELAQAASCQPILRERAFRDHLLQIADGFDDPDAASHLKMVLGRLELISEALKIR